MELVWLTVSHAAVGVSCGAITRWWVLRRVKVVELPDGHLALELCDPEKDDDCSPPD
jgi:hypothetical protein